MHLATVTSVNTVRVALLVLCRPELRPELRIIGKGKRIMLLSMRIIDKRFENRRIEHKKGE